MCVCVCIYIYLRSKLKIECNNFLLIDVIRLDLMNSLIIRHPQRWFQ